MLFNFDENYNNFNKHNMSLLYDKCSLQNNNNIYNELLINMIYYNLSIDNFIILEDNDLKNISKYRKYIVIDENSTKIGIVYEFNISKNMTHNLFIPINNLKHNINKEYLNIDIIYSIQLNEFIHNIDDTKLLIEWFYKNKHNNDKLNININNTKYITHNEDGIEYIIGIQLNYGDFIPVKKINILDYNLEITDKLEGYISYTNRINNFDTSKLLTDLDKDEVNNIKHYEDFTKYIANILYNINSIEKKQIVDLIYSKNKSELLIALNGYYELDF